MKTFGLARVSSHIQAKGTGLEFQTKKMTQYAELHDFELIKVIQDVASGALETRDGIEEIKSEVINGNVDVILVYNTSRCFRSMLHFAKFYEFLEKHNVTLISVSEGIRSDTKEGQMMYGLMISIASYEKEIIKERLMSGKITKAQKGIRAFGSNVLFGYEKNNKNEIVISPKQSSIVKFIFKKYAELLKKDITKSKRMRMLLKSLKKKGYEFKSYQIYNIFKNEFYKGILKFNGIVTESMSGSIISSRLFNLVNA